MSQAEAPLVQLEDVDLMNHYSDNESTEKFTTNKQQLTTEVEVRTVHKLTRWITNTHYPLKHLDT